MTFTRDLDDVLSYLDARREEHLARLVEYLRIPGISAHGTGIGETATHIAGVMREIGLRTEVLATAGWPMVLGRWEGAPGAPTILLYGHYDVQPADPLEAWVSPPFEPEVRDGRLYARGAGDNRGQHFANLLAIEAWLSVKGRLPCNVLFLLEGEEEVGSPHIAQFVREHGKDLAVDCVIVSDGPVHEGGRSMVELGVRGVLSFELRARGANRDLHSGNWGGIVPNPIWTLVHLLASMKNDRGEITIDGLLDDVQPLTDAERDALDALPVDIEGAKAKLGLRDLDEPLERRYGERTAAWPTLTINGFHAGYGGEGSKTVLPHEAVAKCDIRLVEAQTVPGVWECVRAHVERYAPEVEVIFQGGMDPSKTPIASPWLAPIVKAIEVAQGVTPLIVPTVGGTVPNYVWTQILGVPAFGVPYANADEANHAPNENLEVERFYGGIRTGAAILVWLGGMRGEPPA